MPGITAKGASMIPKPTSVRVVGCIGLFLFIFNLVGTIATWNERLPADAQAGRALFFVLCIPFCGLWLIGTAVHRSRLNRMRYK